MDFSYLTVLPRGRQIWDNVVFPPAEFSQRQKRLEAVLDEIGADGFIVYSDGLTRRYVSYLTNYCNSVSWSVSVSLIMKGHDPIVISSMAPRDVPYNKRYLSPYLELNAAGLSLLSNHHVSRKAMEYMKEKGLLEKKWVGVNIKSLSTPGLAPVTAAFPDLPDATYAFDRALTSKSDTELFAITQATAMAKKAGLDYLRMAVPGTTERDIAAGVDRALRVYGADNVALLVSAGKGAIELHQPGDYVIEEGDTVAVHIVVMYLHYHGMFAATLYRGTPDEGRAAYYAAEKAKFDATAAKLSAQRSLAGINVTEGSEYTLAQGIGADVAEGPLAADDAAIGNGAALTLTVCSDSELYGGVIMSDTFSMGSNGLSSMGGVGASAIFIA